MADKKISALTAATTPLAGTEVLPIVQSGSTVKVSVDNLTQGKYTPTDGIKFPATQVPSSDPNTLDEYEEGTWTPSIDSQTAGTSRVTTVYSAKYTRIGNLVYVTCYVAMTTLGSGGSGPWVINGLPFSSAGGAVFSSLSIAFASDLNANVVSLYGYVQQSSTQIRMTGLAAAGVSIDQLDFATYVKAGTSLVISGQYLAA